MTTSFQVFYIFNLASEQKENIIISINTSRLLSLIWYIRKRSFECISYKGRIRNNYYISVGRIGLACLPIILIQITVCTRSRLRRKLTITIQIMSHEDMTNLLDLSMSNGKSVLFGAFESVAHIKGFVRRSKLLPSSV